MLCQNDYYEKWWELYSENNKDDLKAITQVYNKDFKLQLRKAGFIILSNVLKNIFQLSLTTSLRFDIINDKLLPIIRKVLYNDDYFNNNTVPFALRTLYILNINRNNIIIVQKENIDNLVIQKENMIIKILHQTIKFNKMTDDYLLTEFFNVIFSLTENISIEKKPAIIKEFYSIGILEYVLKYNKNSLFHAYCSNIIVNMFLDSNIEKELSIEDLMNCLSTGYISVIKYVAFEIKRRIEIDKVTNNYTPFINDLSDAFFSVYLFYIDIVINFKKR